MKRVLLVVVMSVLLVNMSYANRYSYSYNTGFGRYSESSGT